MSSETKNVYICIIKQTKTIENMNNQITVTSNQSKRTFTIRTEYAKYRTIQFSQDEFDSLEFNTQNDWRQFLNTTSEYYQVK